MLIFKENTKGCWRIDLFLKNDYRPMVKNHSGILSCSSKIKNYMMLYFAVSENALLLTLDKKHTAF